MFDTQPDFPAWKGGWINRLVASPKFQSWASRFPLTRWRARADGQELFDIVQGFVRSQVLMALVELRIFERLRGGPLGAARLGTDTGIAPDRMAILLQGGAALGLLKRRRDGRYGLARQGAALLGVPGLQDMIRHHNVFYRDLEDPVALLRGPEQTGLSEFWPYVFGLAGRVPEDIAETYSSLMTRSQGLVAEDTLRQVSLKGVTRLMDVGGGTGAFLCAAASAAPWVDMDLFDLEPVVAGAGQRLKAAGIEDRVSVYAGSFRDDALPVGADTISLVRVLYDHADETVGNLLSKVYDTLPVGGRLIISEPMGGGATPDPSCDVYFAFYTMAMQTGRTRSSEEIADMCKAVGFTKIRSPKPARAYVTRVVEAVKAD